MNNFEKPKSRLDDPKFIDEFVNVFANELENMVTRPKPGHQSSNSELDAVSKFRETKKIPSARSEFYDLLIRIGQDFRLSADEIEVLRKRFLE